MLGDPDLLARRRHRDEEDSGAGRTDAGTDFPGLAVGKVTVPRPGDVQPRMSRTDRPERTVENILSRPEEEDPVAAPLGELNELLHQVDPRYPPRKRVAKEAGSPYHGLAVGVREATRCHGLP